MEHGGAGVGRGQGGQGPDDLGRGVVEHVGVLGAEEAGSPREVLRIGEGLDEREVVEGHRVRLHVEAALLDLLARAQVDHRADPELAHHGQVRPGQLAQPVGPEEDPPPRAQPVLGEVPAEVAEVHRPLERDQAFDRHATGRSHSGNHRVRSASTGRSDPSMERMRSSSSVSRRSLWLSTGAKG